MRKLLLILALASPLAAHANKQYGPFPGGGSITISGPGIPEQTNAITQYYGEWYITPNDGHVILALMNSETWPRSLTMSLELDGRSMTQTITHETVSPMMGPGHLSFDYNPPGGKQTLVLAENDSITINIKRYDDLNFEATFTGTATVQQTGAGPVQISGAISLHRLKHNEMHSGTWIDCDPVIHDAYATVIPRSASGCEVKYSVHVRQALTQALEPVIAAMEADQWILKARPNLAPVDSEMRGTETSPYKTSAGLDFYLDRSSPVYQHNQQVLDDAAAQMKAQLNGANAMSNPQLMQNMARQIADNTLPTAFHLNTLINIPQTEVIDFSKKHTVTQLPGIGTEIYFDDAQPPTGGSEGAPVTWVLVGSWLPPVFEPLGDHEKAVFRGGLNPAKPLMSAQNYYLVIYATRPQAEKVIGLVDWAPLRALLAEK
ncbi:MAG: hypothetical protein ABSD20_12250 [Terriglobales bacterium]|jgi:hypothetical protein